MSKRKNLSKKLQQKREENKRVDIVYKKDEESTYPHFRFYFKSKHPAMITAEHSKDEWQYRKVMHSDRDGRHLNETFDPNPDSSDKEPMHVARRKRHDRKDNFSKWQYTWEIKNKKE